MKKIYVLYEVLSKSAPTLFKTKRSVQKHIEINPKLHCKEFLFE
jgi:hypothetical protein